MTFKDEAEQLIHRYRKPLKEGGELSQEDFLNSLVELHKQILRGAIGENDEVNPEWGAQSYIRFEVEANNILRDSIRKKAGL